tara:strand:- start:128 stop:319 length:192 start_codon:yes stop_codon:yes gene_type:complete
MQPYLNLLGYRAASESEIDDYVDQFKESREPGMIYTVRDVMAPAYVFFAAPAFYVLLIFIFAP